MDFKSLFKMSIKSKILLLILIVSLLSLSILLIITYRGMQKQGEYAVTRSSELGKDAANRSKTALEEQVKANLTRLVKIQASISNDFFSDIEMQVTIMRHFSSVLRNNKINSDLSSKINIDKSQPELKYLLRTAPNVSQSYIQEDLNILKNLGVVFNPLLQNNKDIEQIFLGTAKGMNLLWPASSAEAVKDYDPRTRAWYKDAVARKGSGWTDLFKAASTQKQLVACSEPVYDNKGNLLGVIGITVSIEGLMNIITTQVKDLGYAFLIDNKGNVIACPGIDKANWERDYGKEGLLKTNNQTVNTAIKRMMKGDSDFSIIKLNSGDKYIGFAPIKATGWSIAVVISVNEAIKIAIETEDKIITSTKETRKELDNFLLNTQIVMGLAFIVIIILVIIISIQFSNRLSKPIMQLSACVEIAGTGNLDSKLFIHTGDEIELLSNGFNKMMDDLKVHIEEIKRVTSEKEKIESELKIATSIQASMLPRNFPPFPNRKEFEIYASMVPAKEVGGDLYDFFFVTENKFCFVIGDVSGKGVTAALFMVRALTLLKSEALRQKDDITPESVFYNVNNALNENNEENLFITSFIVVIDLATGLIEYSNAGHNPPMIKKNEEHKFDYLKTKKSFVMGGMPDFKYKKESYQLNKGDYFFLYTDGVTEAMDAQSKQYSEARLEKVLTDIEDLDVNKLLKIVSKDIEDFVQDNPASDDITMLAFKYNGS